MYQNLVFDYDELSRMSLAADNNTTTNIQYEHKYDAVDNRRAVHATYWNPVDLGLLVRDDFWYTPHLSAGSQRLLG